MVFDEDNLEGAKRKQMVKREHELADEERKPNRGFHVPEHRQYKGHERRDSASDRGKQSDRSWRYREEERGEEPRKVEQRGLMTKYEHQKEDYDNDRDDGRKKSGYEDRYRKYKGRTEDREEKKAVYKDRNRKNREEKGRTEDREGEYEDRNGKNREERGRTEDRDDEKMGGDQDRKGKYREEKGRPEDREDEKKAVYENRNGKYRDVRGRAEGTIDDRRRESEGSCTRDEKGYRKRSMDDKDHRSKHGSENEKGRPEDREDEKKAVYENRNVKYRDVKGRAEGTIDDRRRESEGSYTRDEKGYRKRSMDDKNHRSKHGSENEKRSRKHDEAPCWRDDRGYSKRTDNEECPQKARKR